jgi:hypothetical protein
MLLKRVTSGVLLCSMMACYAVRPVTSPKDYFATNQPDNVWVADTSGEIFHLVNPTVSNDTIVGTLMGTTEVMTMPLSGEKAVFARQPSASKTLTAVGIVGGLAALAAWGIATAGGANRDCAVPGYRGCQPERPPN